MFENTFKNIDDILYKDAGADRNLITSDKPHGFYSCVISMNWRQRSLMKQS